MIVTLINTLTVILLLTLLITPFIGLTLDYIADVRANKRLMARYETGYIDLRRTNKNLTNRKRAS